jgi:hypothetical protein
MASNRTLSRLGLGLGILLLASSAFAQYAGSMRGTVKDSSGGIVPGATVTLQNEANKFTRDQVSDAEGGYYFGGVEPGLYTLKVELTGFNTSETTKIRIGPNASSSLNVVLQVGEQTETIEVVATREMIQTDTGAREGLVTAEQIDNLSIVGRSPLELLRILPGAVTPDSTQMESVGNLTGSSNTNAYQVNGMRGSNNVFTLDGSKLLDIGSNNGIIVVPNNDMVSEVKVQSSNYAAEYGSSGVQVNAITKGGGSEFHGTAYMYARHYKFQANDGSNRTAGVDRPKSEFYYPGGNLMGPILIPGTDFNKNRDKAFFFFGFEVQRQKVDTGSAFAVTPTDGQRNGLFNDYQGGQNLNQPTTVNIPGGYPGAGTAAPGNNLAPYIDPLGQAMMNWYPESNFDDPNNRYNYVFNTLQPQNRLQLNLRLDYNFSDNTKAYIRLAQDSERLEKARGAWWDSSNYTLPSPLNHDNMGRSASLNVTSVLSPTTTNEILFTFSKLKLDIYRQNNDVVALSAMGFPDFAGPWGQQVDVAPTQLYSWGQGLGNLWDPVGQDIYAYNSTLQLTDTFTKVFNTHAVKIGFSVERVRKDQNFQNSEQMAFQFGNWIPGSTGSDFGDLLTGYPAGVDAGTKSVDGNFQLWNIDWFVQDSWKIKKNLTLEYGVRFSKWPNNIERNGYGAYFDGDAYDPNSGSFVDDNYQYVNGVQYVSLGQTDKALIDQRPIFVMPRANFAWDIKGDGDMILRGGGGLFYNRPMGNAEYDVVRFPPLAYAISVGPWDARPSACTNDFMTYDCLYAYNPYSRVGTQNVNGSVDPDSIKYPKTWTASLSFGKRILWDQFLEIGYVGSWGRDLLQSRDINVVPEGALLSGSVGNADLSVPVNRVALDTAAITTYRPYQSLGSIQYWQYEGVSNYHSLQATLSRQTGGRFQYFLAYTFSKALGTFSDEYREIDPFNPRGRSYGVLNYDRTHIVNLSYNWQLPDFVKENAVGKAFLNGWQISGISQYSSGVPMRIGFSGALNQNNQEQAWYGTPNVIGPQLAEGDGAAIMPLITCDPSAGGTSAGEYLLDVNCFGIPTFPETGPFYPSYYMRSPSRMTHDITVFKNFELGGGKRLQFRAGFFNIFNQSFAGYSNQDVDMRLDTTCNVTRDGVPNGVGGTANGVCDPTGGFSYTSNTLDNFGKILLTRGRRIVEFALKFYF